MNNVFSLLVFASFICLIVGLVKPTAFSRFIKGEITRKKIAIIFGIAFLFFSGLLGSVTNPNSGNLSETEKVAEQKIETKTPANQSQQQVITQTPKAVAVSSKARTQFVYDIPSLLDKNYNQIKTKLGKTTKVVQADNQADALFIKQGFEFYVTYNTKTKEVIEFFLVTDDPSGKTQDINRLMDIGNLSKDDARYTVEFTRPIDDKSAYTGITVRTAVAAKAKADRAKAVKDAEKYNVYASVCAKMEVEAMLKAPSTAKFPRGIPDNILFSPEKNSYTVISYVDAQNSFGAMIRTNYICVVADRPDTMCDAQCKLE
ncbi:hypothetical protein HYW83_01000 [Candidatus Peregrinibacteria bacterium]|nr:hypothetical protein [Candidatus Peregrinibacteria bacterium]